MRVLAQVAGGEPDARELDLVLGDVVDLVVVDPAADHHRGQRVVCALAQSRLELLHGDADDRGQTAQLELPRRPVLRQVGRPHLEARAEHVAHEHAAVAVENRATRRVVSAACARGCRSPGRGTCPPTAPEAPTAAGRGSRTRRTRGSRGSPRARRAAASAGTAPRRADRRGGSRAGPTGGGYAKSRTSCTRSASSRGGSRRRTSA